MGVATNLHQLSRSPDFAFPRLLRGVQAANPGQLEHVESIEMVVGSRDPRAAFGRLAYPGRLTCGRSLAGTSPAAGQVSQRMCGA